MDFPSILCGACGLVLLSLCGRGVHGLEPESDNDEADELLAIVAAALSVCAAGLNMARMLRRTATVRNGGVVPGRARRTEVGKRLYAWEEDGYDGREKIRVVDPEGGAPWRKYLCRHLNSYRAQRFRQLFRIPHTMFWEIHDRAVADGWKEGVVNGATKGAGSGSPINLAYKVCPLSQAACTLVGCIESHLCVSGMPRR